MNSCIQTDPLCDAAWTSNVRCTSFVKGRSSWVVFSLRDHNFKPDEYQLGITDLHFWVIGTIFLQLSLLSIRTALVNCKYLISLLQACCWLNYFKWAGGLFHMLLFYSMSLLGKLAKGYKLTFFQSLNWMKMGFIKNDILS